MKFKVRDKKTKKAFIKYLKNNPEQRFFQAVRNFTLENLNPRSTFICSSYSQKHFEDTFDWECDLMLENEK